MNITQWIIFFVIFLLLFNKASRYDALVLFVAYSIYQAFIIDLDAVYYYSCASSFNLIVGLLLHKRNMYAALCSYTLIFVNLLGFFIWYLYLPPTDYDNISLVVLITQVITIAPKGIKNELRRYSKHIMAKSHGFNGIQSRGTMYKIKTHKKEKK